MGLRACVLVFVLLQVWRTELLPNEDFSTDLDSNEWTEWSDWSPCSRNCDGGVSRQVRTCQSSKCEGSAVKYKICNMESCPDSADFRENQCSSFNEYGRTEKVWKPYYHPDEPCALYCVDQNGNIELLAARVEDGTRCRPGSLEMCIDGLCQPVGCDLEIGSLKTIDSCGVCGGSGSTCTRAMYRWGENASTSCSVKCGGGYKVALPVCQNTATNEFVAERFCDISQMPQAKLLECNAGPCPPKWEAGEWSACTQSCGSGIKRRRLLCVTEHNNTKTPVFNPLCKGQKPRMQESCNMQPCPAEWIAGEWSACSVSCGQGTQTRNVTCKAEALQCDPAKRPVTKKRCIGDSCQDRYMALYDEEPSSSAMFYKESNFHVQAEKLVSKQSATSYPAFVAGEWGPCSVTCDEGVRRREVTCQAHLDYTGMTRKLPDSTCNDKKPAEEEPCKMKPCSETIYSWDNMPPKEEFGDDNRESSPKVAPGMMGRRYSWVKMGFTPCTKTCLGGVQELIVNCVRDDNKVVSPYLCESRTQPAVITQTCNDHPCPPRWNVSEYSSCSKTCGMGIRTREVNCIHEVTMSNTAMVPNNMCDQPPPTDRELCNIVDCPTEWKLSNWTKCSKPCGGGVKTRVVTCHQITAQNHDIPHPDHSCETSKPSTSHPCNTRPCNGNRKSNSGIVASVDQQYFTHTDANNHDKVVNLRVGGHASIFAGAKVRIKCPTKNFPRDKIVWMKGGDELRDGERYTINSKKGFLRINGLTAADNTTFTCRAGQSSGTLTIMVLPSRGKFPPNSEESNKFNHQNFDPAITMGYSGNRNYENFEDFSHEGPQDDGRHHNSHSKSKILSTPSYSSPIGATTQDAPTGTQRSKQGAEKDSLLSASSAPSSGSRLMPAFFSTLASLKLLWSFQSVTESVRNHLSLIDNAAATLDTDTNDTLLENLFGASTLLGKIGDGSSVKFEWLIGDWSVCSPSCGGTGFQEREVQCLVRLDNVTQKVEKSMCEDAGVSLPAGTIRNCETDACPHWIVREWQNCSSSRCFTWNTAMQKRDVICQSANGTLVPDAYCKAEEKPTFKQECYNDLCKGIWKVGEWTKCYATCDAEGLRYRILQCVWFGTKKPAGTACRDQPRPTVVKTCRKLCAEDTCADTSKYCPNVKTLHMCQIPRYQAKCCQSCKEDI